MGAGKALCQAPGDLKRCGLDRPYGKSRRHPRISQTDSAVLLKVIGWTAGDDAAHGTKVGDSTGFGISGCPDRYNAKYGTISVKQFAKPRIAHAPHGMTCSAAVTPGRANDSPYLREVLATMPRGSGDMLADAQYGGVENCQTIGTEDAVP